MVSKLCVLFICIFIIKQTTSAPSDWGGYDFVKYFATITDEIRMKCEELSEATDDDIEALEEGKIPETATGKCMIACEFIEYGIINDQKKYNKNALFEMLPKSLRENKALDGVKRLGERCESAVAKVEDGDECELARKLKLCFKQHASEYGIKGFSGFDSFAYVEDMDY